jgi:hypothetical protein
MPPFLSKRVRKQDLPGEVLPGKIFSDGSPFRFDAFEKQIMLTDDIAGSAHTQGIVQFRCAGLFILRGPRARALGVSRAWSIAPRSRAANDNQLAWPCLAFAEDWYASC